MLTFGKATVLALGICTGLVASPASAQPPRVVVEGQRIDPELQRVVTYADLNLRNDAGQKRLLRRVSSAVNELCMNYDLALFPMDRPCSRAAWDSAKPQIARAFEQAQNPLLAATAIVIGAPK